MYRPHEIHIQIYLCDVWAVFTHLGDSRPEFPVLCPAPSSCVYQCWLGRGRRHLAGGKLIYRQFTVELVPWRRSATHIKLWSSAVRWIQLKPTLIDCVEFVTCLISRIELMSAVMRFLRVQFLLSGINHCRIFLMDFFRALAAVALAVRFEHKEMKNKDERCKRHDASNDRTGNGTFR